MIFDLPLPELRLLSVMIDLLPPLPYQTFSVVILDLLSPQSDKSKITTVVGGSRIDR